MKIVLAYSGGLDTSVLLVWLKEKYNAECYVLPFDVCNRESAAAALNALPEEWKYIDVLINSTVPSLIIIVPQSGT